MKSFLLVTVISVIVIRVDAQSTTFSTGGFIRSGFYYSTGDYKYNINAAFADASLKSDITNQSSFRGSADIRAETGQQFGESFNEINVKEAWVTYYNVWFSISAGKKIVKWGKTDFFTPLSKFNPVDYSLRSPDQEDKDMGELIAGIEIFPSSSFKISLIVSPLWNPSIMITRPMSLPENIKLTVPAGFQTGNANYSMGIRTDFTIKSVDIGLQWFHGTDPMPGLKLDSTNFENIYNPYIRIKGVPYNINSVGVDFEAAVSSLVIRGAFAYCRPVDGKKGNEWVPFAQTEWVAGLDYTPGDLTITVEYSGKAISGYYKSPYPPVIGTNPDLAALAVLFSTPGFDPVEYSRLQVEAFNRLYNNQLYRNYHSAGIRFGYDLFYGRLTPSISAVYNFTSHNLVVFPSVKYKPVDGVTIMAGMENYSGKNGSLFGIIDDFMNVAYALIRIDF